MAYKGPGAFVIKRLSAIFILLFFYPFNVLQFHDLRPFCLAKALPLRPIFPIFLKNRDSQARRNLLLFRRPTGNSTRFYGAYS